MTVPEVVVAVGNEAIVEYARDFARTVELFVRSHVRFVIRPSGEMDVNEMGFYQPWLEP